MVDIARSFVQLAKLSLGGRQAEAILLARRTFSYLAKHRPDLEPLIAEALAVAGGELARSSLALPLPVDADSRLELLKRETVAEVSPEPTWPAGVAEALSAVIAEREREDLLLAVGLAPTRSLLFVGSPGVGKTLAARWLASKLARPLLTLDLAAVMSSFLGKTGNNIRVVLDYARRYPSVLLLDEFDAIAKRRDDSTEIGELKRLVTVLLQAVDEWPADGLLIAATNHAELLDPAVWRRFDQEVSFPLPSVSEIVAVLSGLLLSTKPEVVELLGSVLAGSSFSDVARLARTLKRKAALADQSEENVVYAFVANYCAAATLERRLRVAEALDECGRGQREISTITRLARETLRSHGIAIKTRKRG